MPRSKRENAQPYFTMGPSFHNRKNLHILLLWKHNDWQPIVFPGGAKAVMGEGGWLVTFSSNKCHSTCIVISDTSPCISPHIRLLDSFPSFLIFGSEREPDLEVAAGTWKYGLSCLFSLIRGCAAAILGDFKELSIVRLWRHLSHPENTSPVTC